MNVFIVEDEELGVERMIKLLTQIDPKIIVAGTAGSIERAVEWLNHHQHPELILMDIELSDGQSFEIFKRVEVRSAVVFTTSYDEYALKAFKVNSIDYLLKPVKKEELKESIDKYWRLHQIRNAASAAPIDIEKLIRELQVQKPEPSFRSRFLVKYGQRLVSVETSDIAYFFADGRFTYFITWSKLKYLVDYTLEELESMLDPVEFFRANRGLTVHIRAIMEIHTFFNGKLKLDLKPDTGQEALVSREKAGSFKEWMGK